LWIDDIFYGDKLHFDETKTLEEAIIKAKYIYKQSLRIPSFQKDWDHKKRGNMDYRKKGFKPPFF
jgi:hypothetical protein